jgi:Fe-S-cluster-containing dehydrogenase component
MKKWNLIVDVALCENCRNCTLAAKDEHVGNDFPGYAAPAPARGHDWIRIARKVRGSAPMVDAAYLPTMCNHCDDAPCVKAGKGAVRKRDDGIVILDPVKSRGRRDLVDACPYGAIVWNEELALPQAWIFDAHLLDAGGKEPRCAQACPTAALRAVKQDDATMQAQARAESLEVLRPELGTKPRVYYRNLHRFDKCFIGGSVVAEIDGVTECVAHAAVVVRKDGAEVARAATDVFGDFKCDGFEPNSGVHTVEIAHPRLGSAFATCTLGESAYLGTLRLSVTAPAASADEQEVAPRASAAKAA